MTKPNCPKCGHTEFQQESYTREHLHTTLELIYCLGCGAVVGGAPFTGVDQQDDIMIALEGLSHEIDRVKAALRNK